MRCDWIESFRSAAALHRAERMTQEFDYIVVGAGSAGCVLAARLSEDPATRVLLLEAGPPDRSLWIHLPIGYGKTMWSPTYNWCFHTDPDPDMNGRAHLLAARQDARRLELDQRPDLHPRPARGLRPLGRAGQRRLGLRRRAAVLHPLRGQPARRRSPGMAATARCKVSDIGAKHELIEAFIDGAGSSRRAAHRRLQRRAPGGRGLLPAQHLEGLALQHRQGLPGAGPRRGQPARRDRRAGQPASSSTACAPSACATGKAA